MVISGDMKNLRIKKCYILVPMNFVRLVPCPEHASSCRCLQFAARAVKASASSWWNGRAEKLRESCLIEASIAGLLFLTSLRSFECSSKKNRSANKIGWAIDWSAFEVRQSERRVACRPFNTKTFLLYSPAAYSTTSRRSSGGKRSK